MQRAAGTIFVSKTTKRMLLNFRAETVSNPLKWGLWGGKIEPGEKVLQALHREMTEEIGFMPDLLSLHVLDVFSAPDQKFYYYSFAILVENEFIPKLNPRESAGYAWVDIGNYPKPLHGGAKKVLEHPDIIKHLKNLVK